MSKERILVVFILLVYTNLLGLFSLPPLMGINLIDFSLLSLIAYFFYFLYAYRRLSKKVISTIGPRNILFFLLITILVAISMIFRDTGTIYSGIRTGRTFFILLIFLPIFVDIFENKNYKFWNNVILFIGIWYSFIVFANFLFPTIANNIFRAIILDKIEDTWGTTSSRYIIKSNYGILFIHLSFLLSIIEIFVRKKRINWILIILSLGMLMQGWRAILATILISLLLATFVFKIKGSSIQIIRYAIIAFIISIPIDFLTNNSISSKFISAKDEISGEYQGSLTGRMSRAEVYALPEYLKRPIWGHGFIMQKTTAENPGEKSYDKTYLLYNFDYAYLTMFIMFGAVLMVIIFFLFYQILYYLGSFKNRIYEQNSESVIATFTFFMALIFANYSFGGLISAVGLLPLGVIMGLGFSKHLSIYKINPQELNK